MTKERRLAIEMWEGIRDMLSASDGVTHGDVVIYKRLFCSKHYLRWTNYCWFCKYIPVCNKCPLKLCDGSSLYNKVTNDMVDKDVRIDACTNIIKALRGKA